MIDTTSSPTSRGSAETVNAVGFTSKITAGFRAVELQHIENPIIIDPLSPYLAGEDGFKIAVQDWQDLAAQQGPGKHLRVPARNRIMDDALCSALVQLIQQHSMHNAALTTVQVVNVGYTPVPADLSKTTLAEVLPAAGFDRSCSTVWIAEALIYYIPLTQAAQLLSDMRELSPSHNAAGGQAMTVMQQAGWQLNGQALTSAQLARERYAKETYVALYGGAECCFTADPAV
eukprot:gene9887-10044_t